MIIIIIVIIIIVIIIIISSSSSILSQATLGRLCSLDRGKVEPRRKRKETYQAD